MVNTIGTLNLLTVSHRAAVKKFIQTSTSEVYGSPDSVPIREDARLKPQSPYSASKISSDAFAMSFYYSFGLPVAIIRPFNTYGPRQSARAVIPTVIMQALNSDSVKLGLVTPRRDFTYVKDTVRGFIQIAESDRSCGEVINIGTGRDYSISELVGLISKILGKKLIIIRDRHRIRPEKSEVVKLRADNSEAKRILHWKPEYTFEEGIRQSIDFISGNSHLYSPSEYVV